MIFSILFLDFDGFKAINDKCGHHVGDEILIEFSKELRTVLPENSHASRWGGDEFVVILPSASSVDANDIATKTTTRFDQPFQTAPLWWG